MILHPKIHLLKKIIDKLPLMNSTIQSRIRLIFNRILRRQRIKEGYLIKRERINLKLGLKAKKELKRRKSLKLRRIRHRIKIQTRSQKRQLDFNFLCRKLNQLLDPINTIQTQQHSPNLNKKALSKVTSSPFDPSTLSLLHNSFQTMALSIPPVSKQNHNESTTTANSENYHPPNQEKSSTIAKTNSYNKNK